MAAASSVREPALIGSLLRELLQPPRDRPRAVAHLLPAHERMYVVDRHALRDGTLDDRAVGGLARRHENAPRRWVADAGLRRIHLLLGEQFPEIVELVALAVGAARRQAYGRRPLRPDLAHEVQLDLLRREADLPALDLEHPYRHRLTGEVARRPRAHEPDRGVVELTEPLARRLARVGLSLDEHHLPLAAQRVAQLLGLLGRLGEAVSHPRMAHGQGLAQDSLDLQSHGLGVARVELRGGL